MNDCEITAKARDSRPEKVRKGTREERKTDQRKSSLEWLLENVERAQTTVQDPPADASDRR